MNKIEIKDRYTGDVLFSHECESNNMLTTVLEAIKVGAGLSDANLSDANLSDANLSGAGLSRADLRYANLSGADLSGADLSDANLSRADLRYANLSGAGLSRADLRYANLSGATLDFSCLHFSCASRKPKTDERQRIQLCHHLLSWIKYSDNATDFEKQLFEFAKEYANKFHRCDVEKFN